MNPSNYLVSKGRLMKFRLSSNRFKQGMASKHKDLVFGELGFMLPKRNLFRLRLFERLRLYLKRILRGETFRWRF